MMHILVHPGSLQIHLDDLRSPSGIPPSASIRSIYPRILVWWPELHPELPPKRSQIYSELAILLGCHLSCIRYFLCAVRNQRSAIAMNSPHVGVIMISCSCCRCCMLCGNLFPLLQYPLTSASMERRVCLSCDRDRDP